MSEIKILKEIFRTKFMQITHKIWKLKDIYEKVLKEVARNLRKVLNKSFKSIKKVLQALEFVRKSPPAENTHHAETSQWTRYVNKLTAYNKMQAQNQRRLQNRLE